MSIDAVRTALSSKSEFSYISLGLFKIKFSNIVGCLKQDGTGALDSNAYELLKSSCQKWIGEVGLSGLLAWYDIRQDLTNASEGLRSKAIDVLHIASPQALSSLY